MLIIIIARNFPKKRFPLNGIFEFDQARALKEYGHTVVFVSIDLMSLRRRRRLGKYWTKLNGIDIVNISVPLGRVPVSIRTTTGRTILKFIYPEIERKFGRPDVVHAHFHEFGKMAMVLKKYYQIPLVITEHSSQINEITCVNGNELEGEVYSSADRLLAVSSSLSNKISELWGIKASIIPNVVDLKSFSAQKVVPTKDFHFISIGNLIDRKGFKLLIQSFHEARFERNIKLSIIGDGPDYKDLCYLINNFGLKNQVKLLGRLNRKEIFSILQKSNVFVLPSKNETFGVVYIEAMLAGLPVIATSCGGPEDFINQDNGLLIPVNDSKSLTMALKHMYINYDKFNRTNISKSVKAKFSPQIIAENLTKIYNSLVSIY